MSKVITLPGGIVDSSGELVSTVELAELTGIEEDILADTTVAADGSGKPAVLGPVRLTKVLSGCTVRIGSLRRPEGSDRFSNPGFFEEIWSKAFTVDRSVALIHLRMISLGNSYIYPVRCPHCGFVIERVNTDLSTIEEGWTAPDRVLLKEKVHGFTTPSGVEVQWRSLVGADEPLIQEIKSMRAKDQLTAVLMLRCVSVGGDSTTGGKYRLLRQMPSMDRNAIRQQFPKVEGVQDRGIDLTCANTDCRKSFRTGIDVSHPNFFFPSEI